jgi:hypothetical protein
VGVPVVRQLRVLGDLIHRNGALGTDAEMDPTVAVSAPTNKAGVVPPRAQQAVVWCSSMILQAKINRLHRLPATNVRTSGLGVDDVRCHLSFLTPCRYTVCIWLSSSVFGVGASCAILAIALPRIESLDMNAFSLRPIQGTLNWPELKVWPADRIRAWFSRRSHPRQLRDLRLSCKSGRGVARCA